MVRTFLVLALACAVNLGAQTVPREGVAQAPGGAAAVLGNVQVQGRVVDQSGLALPGVTVRLVETQRAPGLSVVTGGDGAYVFGVAPGRYLLEAELDGFEKATREIQAGRALTVPDIVLPLAHFSQETTVVAAAPTELQPRSFGAPSTIAEKVIDNAPLRTNRYDDVLPLLPNVVRGPDGLISVAGARAPQGIVLLNGVPAVDVATGEPVAAVPLAAVESVQVIATGFPAEFGRSSGGVTVVNSRSGNDTLRFSVNSFTPRPRLDEKGIHGIEAWQPNMGIRGPLARGRAWFAQSLDYRYDRTKVDTLAGEQDRRLHSVTSLTQFDFKPSPTHVVSAWFNGQAENVDDLGLSAFTPAGTVPNAGKRRFAGALIDRATLGSSATLETRVEVDHQGLSLESDDSAPYVVGHDITSGSYFATTDRHALSLQASTVLSRAWSGPTGGHLVKVGASLTRGTLVGTSVGRPVTYLRSSLVPARVVTFSGTGAYDASAVDAGVFLQDTWSVSGTLALDFGLRVDGATRVGAVAAPRVGFTWRLDEKTTVSGGAGVFADKTPLAALAFPGFQSRSVTLFDEAGIALGPATTHVGVLADDLDRARARMWSAQVDRRLARGWHARIGYQERRGRDELLVVPSVGSGGERHALLTSDGQSRSRSLETTLGFRPDDGGHQFYVSYVRSSARGHTNDFSQVEGTLRDPLLLPGGMAPLPTDVPHRLLAWGLFSLPARVTVAPFLEVRSGFPFSAVADDWSYAGARYGQRFPTFASLDVIVNKVVTLPGGMRARVGVKLYNLAGRGNGRDIQRDIERADFGTTYNPLGRQVRGVFELIWGGGKK